MKKVLSLVLALMLLVMIPVEAVAATRVKGTDYAQQWYAPDGGTVTGFQPKNPDQLYPLYVVYFSKQLTDDVLIYIQDEDVMDYIEDNAKSMTISAIAEGVGWALDSKRAEKVVEVVLSFSLWALNQAKIDEARENSEDGKIMMIQWCSPGFYTVVYEMFYSWEGDYVDDTQFGAVGCVAGTSRRFLPGDYGPYNDYK